MPKVPFHYVDLRAFSYATEDVKRVEQALYSLLPEDVELERVENVGHHGDRIVVLSARVERADEMRHVLDRLAELEDLDRVLDELDERVDDWSEREPAELAAEVTPHAAAAEYEEVFEDTVPRGRPDVGMGSGGDADSPGHDHAHDHDHSDSSPGAGVPDPESVDDPEVAEALREAREMTREARDEPSGDDRDTDADTDA
ncbi:hypothetical protein DJ71_07915 [Halorubrum sp. E3]|nr:hypothetical protein DJ71_07915 [Halorubrum sp. E3]